MDLQTRKLNLIKPFTVEDFFPRIEKSELDFKNGNVKNQEDEEKTHTVTY